jgi:hypothetical protein
MSLESAYQQASDVYIVEISRIDKHLLEAVDKEYIKTVGIVIETLKGNPLPGIIVNEASWGMCDMKINKGDMLLTFMFSMGETSFQVCHPNTMLENVNAELLASWRKSTSNK